MSFIDKPSLREKALLVSVIPPGDDSELESVEELGRLAETAGATVVGRVIQRRDKVSASTYVGKGKLEEIAKAATETGADLVLVDNDLGPAQSRNIEKRLKLPVVDRTELILDIFARHARTKEAMLQIELAQLTYALPRLKRLWTHLSRMKRGIATRGPGETQLESDRRLVKTRIADLSRELDDVVRRRERVVRSRSAEYRVGLVGYTNAGKSSLFRRLTGVDVLVEDKLFSTLDTRTRVLHLPGKPRVLLSDTVGFIRNLPHSLVASFHATLAEVAAADLLLHVVDASSAQPERQIAAVESVLREIGASEIPTILVLNKADVVRDRGALPLLAAGRSASAVVSAATGEGVKELESLVSRCLDERRVEVEFFVPEDRSGVMSTLGRWSEIVEASVVDGGLRVVAILEPKHIPGLERDGARVLSRVGAAGRNGRDGTGDEPAR